MASQSASLRYQIGWMAGHWRPYAGRIPLLLFLTLANAAAVVAYPYLLQRIIDNIVAARSLGDVLPYVGAMVLVGIAHFVVYASLQMNRAGLNVCFEFGVRMRAFEYLLSMGPGFFARFRTGDVVTRLVDDVNDKLAWYMCAGVFRVLEALAVVAFCVAMMLAIDPTLTLYAAGPLPLLVVLFVATRSKLHARYEDVQASISHLNDVLESCFSGIRVVKAFTAEPQQRQLVDGAIERQRRAEVRAVRWQTIIDSLYGDVWQLAIVGVLLVGGAMAIDGRITLGEIVAFDSYVLMLVMPMFDVGQFLVRGRLSAVSIGRIDELERSQPDVIERDAARPVTRRPQDVPSEEPAPAARPLAADRPSLGVRMEGITYRYRNAADDVLADITFAARPGRVTAVVGEIGAGKSTAMMLLARLIDPTEGRVLVGGRDARDWNPVELRRAIGYVPQEAQLLSGSVLENVRFGRNWIDPGDIDAAIDIARLRGDLAVWPDGLETRVGSRGLRISGGQQQRVALARALAGRPSLLLLDDCTASLDAETEQAVWNALLAAMPGCTTILVTHRPAALRRCDQIVVLDRGRIRELGTFDDLDRDETHFHRLFLRWSMCEDVPT